MSVNQINSTNTKNGLTLQVGKIHYCSIRQYVAKVDQFMYLLELEHVLFPAHTNMKVKSDFRAALNRTKKSINHLKNKLFGMANSVEPNCSKLAEMRNRRKRKGIDLSPPIINDSNEAPKRVKFTEDDKKCDVIDITDDDEISNVDTFAVDNVSQPNKVDAFAINDVLQPKNVDNLVVNTVSQPVNVDASAVNCTNRAQKASAFSATDSKINEAAISLLALKNQPVTDIVHLKKVEKPMTVTQRVTLLNRGELIERIRTYGRQRVDLYKSKKAMVESISPTSNNNSGVINLPQKELPIVEINGISYAIDTVDFEVLPF
jgi:hypothetical protein